MKIIKIVIINLLLFLLLFHVSDFGSTLLSDEAPMYEISNENKLLLYCKYYNVFHNYSIYSSDHLDSEYNNLTVENYAQKNVNLPSSYKFRPLENIDAPNSIVLFGCSFAYGYHLNDNETFSYNLGKLLPNYKIYNRAKSGWTTSHMLYQLENKDFSEYKNVKYVIYLYIDDHLIRNKDSHLDIFTPYYKLSKNNTLTYQKYSFKYLNFPLKKFLRGHYISLCYNYLKDIGCNLTKKEIMYSRANAELVFPDAQFIIFRYNDGKSESADRLFNSLNDAGFIVVSLDDFFNIPKDGMLEYQNSKTDPHPNARAWAEITPLFVKYLRNNGYLQD